jgi:O-antigen ligase
MVDMRLEARRRLSAASPTVQGGGPERLSPDSSGRGWDVFVGVAVALVACSNLVQGIWISALPWLNLTQLGFVAVVPAALVGLTQRIPLRALVAMLLLLASITLGFIEPATSSSASSKRVALLIAVVFVLVASALAMSRRLRVTAFFTTVVVLASVVVLAQLFLPDPLALLTGRRTPMGLNSIGAARLVGAAIIIAVAAWLNTRVGARKILLTLLIVPLSASLLLAGSRGAVLGVAVALLILIFGQPGIRTRTRIAVTLLLAAGGIGILRFLQESGSRLASTAGSGRWQLYRDSVEVAVTHPWGVGWGNFYRYVQLSAAAGQQGEDLYAHNIFLEFWIETGAVGSILFTIFLLVTFRAALRRPISPANLILIALSADLLVGAMLSSDIIGNRMMWATLGALLASTGLARQEEPIDAPTRSGRVPRRQDVSHGQRHRARLAT